MTGRKLLCVILTVLMLVSCLDIFAVAEVSGIDELEFCNIDDYAGKRIGILSGSIYVDTVNDMIENPEVYYYSEVNDAFLALKSGKIDAVLSDEFTARKFCDTEEGYEAQYIEGTKDSIAFAADKDEEGKALISEINAYIKEITENGKLEELQQKWLFGDEDGQTMEDYSSYPETNGKLVIGTAGTIMPFTFQKEGITVGYDIEILTSFCKEYGYKPVVEIVSFDGLIAGVQSGKFDIIGSSITVTDERKEFVEFSTPVFTSYPTLVSKATNEKTSEFVDTSIFTGRRIGVQTGTIYVDDYGKYVEDAEILPFTSLADATSALLTGKIDAIIQDEPLLQYLASQNEQISCARLASPGYLMASFADKSEKGEKYVSELSEYILSLKANGKLEELKAKWISGKEEDRVMEDYSSYPATNGTIVIATDSVLAPFSYKKDGKIVGYEIEIVSLFCKAYGYKPEFVQCDVGGIIAGVNSGQYDIGAGCFFITEERQQVVLFAESIYECYGGIAYNSNVYVTVKDFAGKRIGVGEGTSYVDLVSQFVENPQVSVYSSLTNSFTALTSGKIDAFITDEISVLPLLEEDERVRYITIKSYADDIAFVLDKTEQGDKIRTELNEFIAKITENGELKKLQDEWIYGNADEAEIEDYTQYPATNGTIVVATNAAYEPFEYFRDNTVVGYEIELFAMFCKEYGYAIDVQICEFGGIIAGVKAGRYDIGISCFSVTEERKKEVNFTDPIFVSYPALAYLEEENEGTGGFFDSIIEGFKKTFITENRWKDFAEGIGVTMEITVLSILFGTILGFIIHIICRRGNKVANLISKFARWLIQGMPVVVFIMIMFYIILGNLDINGIMVAIISFTLIFACSMHSMLEGAEKAIDPGQAIGATALGYSNWKAFTRILLPQEIKFFIPSFLTEVSSHIKATAVVGYIAVVDLTKVGDLIRGRTYEPFFPLIAVAILYFILAGILRIIVKIVSKKLDVQRRSEKQILKGAEIK